MQGKTIIRDIAKTFQARILELEGEVRETAEADQSFFARAVINRRREIRPGDSFQGGVALRAEAEYVEVKPYLFRLVCRNGAITAYSAGCEKILAADYSHEAYLQQIADTIARC